MIVYVQFETDNSIYFYKEKEVLFYMKRVASFGKIIGEIYSKEDKRLIRIDTSQSKKISILDQELPFQIEKRDNFLLKDVFIINNKETIDIFNFLLVFGKIYWNDKLISTVKYKSFFKYKINLELNYNTTQEFIIYY